jgi:hypothetical protein
MARATPIEVTEVTLTKDDIDTLRRNTVLAVDHPQKDGVILFHLCVRNHSHDTQAILRDPVVTGNTVDRLLDGEIITYGSKLRVKLAPEEVAD